jgi:hypothetical protein
VVGGLTGNSAKIPPKSTMDNGNYNGIPQEGPAQGGESLLPKGSRSTDSGGSNHVPATKNQQEEAEQQASSKVRLLGQIFSFGENDQEKSPFQRSSAMKRTPPRGDSFKTKDLPETRVEIPILDLESSPEEEIGKRKRKDGDDFRQLESLITKIMANIKTLETLVAENGGSNTTGVPAVSATLSALAAKVEQTNIKAILEEATALAKQETKVSKLATSSVQTGEAGTQTEAWYRKGKTPTVGSLEGIKSFSDFAAVADLKWEDAVGRGVRVLKGHPLETPCDTVKCVLIDPKDQGMKLSIQWLYRVRFPMLAALKEEVNVVEQVTRLKGPGGNPVESSQKVVKIHHDGSERSIWDRLQDLKRETEGDKSVAIHTVRAMPKERLKKMTMAVFQGSPTTVTIYTDEEETAASSTAEPSKLPRKERNTLALSVEGGGRSFKEVLQGVRDAVKSKPGCEAIQALRSTREEKLLIVLNKDDKARDKVIKLLEGQNLKVSQVGPRTKTEVIHLRGLDQLATREEVAQAVEQAVGPDPNTVVGPLRPYWRSTQAVTVTMTSGNAEKLIAAGKLRVGPTACKAEKRVVVKRCSKCWSFDHSAGKCDGPDRSKLCMGCGKTGHQSRECKEKKSCVLCNGEEHALGSGQCPAFRKALAKSKGQKESRQKPKRRRRNQQPEVEQAEQEEDMDFGEDHPSSPTVTTP